MLDGKTVVVGICGGIAAYKAVEVVSRLRKLNADVHVIMTRNATRFVTPLTFQTLSQNPVVEDMFAKAATWEIEHISLARKADLVAIVPATANIIGKIACGIADDMLTTTVTATKAPVLIVPAMNPAMYENPIVQENIRKLARLDYAFMEPETGRVAEGGSGKGRLPEPVSIVDRIVQMLLIKRDMEGVRVLVTAGPTREPIDPVRYISNRSSGKMGYAIASAAAGRGACVKLISGPVNLPAPHGVEMVKVNSAMEMRDEVMASFPECDALIMAAAVADYRCRETAGKKIKKAGGSLLLELTENPDILAEAGKMKGSRVLAGACAETENLLENAKDKLMRKNLDLIMANDVTMEGAGFETDTNIVKIIKSGGEVIELPLMSKKAVAEKLLDEVVALLDKKRRTI